MTDTIDSGHPYPSAERAAFSLDGRNGLKPQRRTLQDNVYDMLKSALVSGVFVPGQQVPVREIQAMAGTSAMPIREALRRLLAEGAFEALPNGTVRVCELDADERAKVLEIRIALEGMAAERAAVRVSSRDIAHLEYLNQDIKRALADGDARVAALRNQEFHFELYRRADSTTLMRIIEGLWMQSGPYLHRYLQLYLDRNAKRHRYDTLRFHGDLLAGLRARDAAAVAASVAEDIRHTTALYDDSKQQSAVGRGRTPATE